MTMLTSDPMEVPFWLAVVIFLGMIAGGLYIYHHYLQQDDHRHRHRRRD